MAYSSYWLVATGVFLLLEAFGLPGIGFLFAGLAALVTAAAIELGFIGSEALILQLALFSIVTAISAMLLWRKLKSWRMNPNAPHYSNIVGTEAVTVEGLSGSKLGTVRWSGTLMSARLADPHHAPISPGTTVRITTLDGSVLVVIPA